MRKEDNAETSSSALNIRSSFSSRIVGDRKHTSTQNMATLGVPAAATRVGLFGLRIRAWVINTPDNVRLDRNRGMASSNQSVQNNPECKADQCLGNVRRHMLYVWMTHQKLHIHWGASWENETNVCIYVTRDQSRVTRWCCGIPSNVMKDTVRRYVAVHGAGRVQLPEKKHYVTLTLPLTSCIFITLNKKSE